METVLIAIGAGILYLVAYHTYGKWLARRIFQLNPEAPTPSMIRNDGRDYVPSDRQIVFGHHFTSIAGTGPIVGPAIAVIWGWLPALLWVIFGSILIGAVHDFASLVMSLRNQGRTIGDYCGDIINRRVRLLFMLIIFFALWIVIAIFGLVIANVFARFPQAVFPVWFQIPIAIALGIWMRRGGNLIAGTIVAVILMYLTIFLGAHYSFLQYSWSYTGLSAVGFWTILLLIYCFVASILPVQVLLQPRDYINAYQLVIAMALLFLGILFARPHLVAPAVNDTSNIGAPFPLMPFLFITVACGACSGFHCLVSSGTSSKQLRKETDAQFVGYGAMLLEGFLAVIVILACCAGLGMGYDTMIGGSPVHLVGAEAWGVKYASWAAADGLGNALAAVITGSANMMQSYGLTAEFAQGVMGVFVASFAATTLDSSTRLQRYVISELGETVRLPILKDKYLATAIAVLTGLLLAFFDVFKGNTLAEAFRPDLIIQRLQKGGAGAVTLWPLFGATNQLLAGLALLVATVWLYRKQKPIVITAIPMLFMLVMTGWGLVQQLVVLIDPSAASGKKPDFILFSIGVVILLLEVWMVIEAAVYVYKLRSLKARGVPLPELAESA